jgi:hypothetical protein
MGCFPFEWPPSVKLRRARAARRLSIETADEILRRNGYRRGRQRLGEKKGR